MKSLYYIDNRIGVVKLFLIRLSIITFDFACLYLAADIFQIKT